MNSTRVTLSLSFAAIGIFLLPLASPAQSFKFAAINVPGAKTTVANGINGRNVVVGTYVDSANQTFGFKFANGTYTKINVPGSTQTMANGIADNGDIVGTYSVPTSPTQPPNSFGFRLHAGVFSKVQCAGSEFTGAGGINKFGTIVGGCETSKGDLGFIDKGGSFRFVNAPTNGGNPDTQLNGVANSGEVAGQVFAGDDQRGFYIPNGTTGGTDPDFLKPFMAIDNLAEGVNSRGDVVGCDNASKAFIAFTPESGETSEGSSEAFPTLHNFAPFGSNNSCAMGINFNRAIVGWYYDSSFIQHGFLAIPQ